MFAKEEYARRRQDLAATLEAGSIAVVAGRIQTGAFDIFRQNNEFLYLSGVEVPQSYLSIEGKSGETTLYLPGRDAKLERSEGAIANADDPEAARLSTGVDHVKHHEQLANDLAKYAIVYTPLQPGEGKQMCRDTLSHGLAANDRDPWDSSVFREQAFVRDLSAKVTGIEVKDLVPRLDQLRGCKSEAEVGAMRVAGELSAKAVAEAMKSTSVGLYEYQLAAVAEYVFRVNGADGGAYRPIVASGKNIWNAHYYRNNHLLGDGDLVLMDYAPDYHHYTSDIGRMWPVNGTYSPWQRELYGYIVEYHKVLLGLIRPGRMAREIEEEAAVRMRTVIESRSWSKESFRQAALATLEFHGHLSHGVGMAVHDVWDYRKEPLRSGVVFALDPQMWVHEEELYIRVEDTVVVTETGVENLTSAVPLELDEVEALMRSEGIAQKFPPI